MHCPICKQSFGKGVKRCPLHGARLVDTADQVDRPPPAPVVDEEEDATEHPTITGPPLILSGSIGRRYKMRFIADQQIGEGAMGIVYRGRDLSKSPPAVVAIKVLKAQESDELGLEARFKREAMLVSKLDHPNTIHFVDWGAEPDGTLFLVTELLAGQPLDRLLEANPNGIGEDRTLDIIDQVAASLADAHAKGVVHRDVKPANVFVDGARAKLLDFGIARIAFNGMELSQTFAAKTRTGMAMFTPMYCSPEQAVGDELDHRSDIYSLGVVAYHCLTGKTPFKGGLAGLIEAHLSKDPPPIKERAPEAKVMYATEMLVRRMLAKRPEQRPQDAGEIRAAIAEIRGDAKPTRLDLKLVRKAARPDPAPAATQKMPRWFLPVMGVGLLLVGYVVLRALLLALRAS